MRLTCQLDIDSFGAFRKECALEEVYEVFFCDLREHFDLLILAFEKVLVRANLTPKSSVFLVQIDVLLRHFHIYSLFLHLKFLLRQILYFLAHFDKKLVD